MRELLAALQYERLLARSRLGNNLSLVFDPSEPRLSNRRALLVISELLINSEWVRWMEPREPCQSLDSKAQSFYQCKSDIFLRIAEPGFQQETMA